MANKIYADPDVIDATATRIENNATDYQRNYDLLYTRAEELSQDWKDADAQAFTSQIEGFKDDFQKMYGRMLEYVDFLRKTATTYRETQEANVANARKLQN